jgi:Tol biopolymer transport system component
MTQITFGSGPDFSPMPDPSGKGIYYVNGKATGSLISYNVKTGVTSEISSDLPSQPIVSPDGKRVVYIRTIDPNKALELWVSDIDGKNAVKIASATRMGTGFWSPDSSRITFFASEKQDERYRGYIADATGSNVIQIADIPANIGNISWSADAKSLYVSGVASRTMVWRMNADGTNPVKFADDFYAMEATPDGKYLLGVVLAGKDSGIFQVSTADGKRTALIPGISTFMVRMAPDQKGFVYSIPGRNEIVFYRQEWADGKCIGEPEVAVKVPFTFPLQFRGNAYDFSPDLSTIVYARPAGQADLYLLQPGT